MKNGDGTPGIGASYKGSTGICFPRALVAVANSGSRTLDPLCLLYLTVPFYRIYKGGILAMDSVWGTHASVRVRGSAVKRAVWVHGEVVLENEGAVGYVVLEKLQGARRKEIGSG